MIRAALLLCGACALAQDFTQRGYVDLRTTLFPQTAPNDSGRAILDTLMRYEAALKLTPWLKVYGAFDARADTHRQFERRARIDWQDRGIKRPAFSLRRLSAVAFRGPVTVEVGKQFIRWGKADILNPLDRFAPRDFLNVIDNDYLGVLAARLTVERGAHTVDFVVQPRFTPSRTPLLNQRWIVLDTSAFDPAVPVNIEQGEPQVPGGGQIGVRWNYLGAGYEVSLVFYEGHNHLPLLDASLRVVPDFTVRIFNTFPQLRLYGAAAAAPLEWFTLKGEAAFFSTNSAQADDYFLYVLQAERTQGEWTFVGGYAGEHVTARRVQLDFAPDRGIGKAFLGRASYAIDTNRALAFEAALRQNGAGLFLKSEYTHTLSTHWQARASFTLIRGQPGDFLGQYRRNSHAILGMRYSF